MPYQCPPKPQNIRLQETVCKILSLEVRALVSLFTASWTAAAESELVNLLLPWEGHTLIRVEPAWPVGGALECSLFPCQLLVDTTEYMGPGIFRILTWGVAWLNVWTLHLFHLSFHNVYHIATVTYTSFLYWKYHLSLVYVIIAVLKKKGGEQTLYSQSTKGTETLKWDELSQHKTAKYPGSPNRGFSASTLPVNVEGYPVITSCLLFQILLGNLVIMTSLRRKSVSIALLPALQAAVRIPWMLILVDIVLRTLLNNNPCHSHNNTIM